MCKCKGEKERNAARRCVMEREREVVMVGGGGGGGGRESAPYLAIH